MLAQRQIAERIAVLEQMRAVLARERAETLTDAHFVHPGIGQPRPAGEDGVLACVEGAAKQPDQFLVTLAAVVGSGSRRRIADRRGEKAGAAPRLQVPQRDQPIVGLHHGEAAHAIGFGEFADGRKLGPRPQAAIIDLPADAIDNLIDQRIGVTGINFDGDHRRLSGRSDWPVVVTSTVPPTVCRSIHVCPRY
jgi:hypothetical protein